MESRSKGKSLANVETDSAIDVFLEGIKNKKRRSDGYKVLQLMKSLTGKEPKIWGRGIVAFGKYSYQRKNGDLFEWFNVGFSPAKKHITIYVMYDLSKEDTLLKKLGPHQKGKGCLYIKDLDKIDLKVLSKIISKSDRW